MLRLRWMLALSIAALSGAMTPNAHALPFNLVPGLQHNGGAKVDITDPNNDNTIDTAEWGAGPTVVAAPGNGVGTYNTLGQGEVVAKVFDNGIGNSGPWGGGTSKTCCNFTPGTTSIAVTSATGSYGLVGYTLTNGNDSPSRRPVAWRLEGSNNNFATSTLIDTVVASDINGGAGWTADNQTGEVVFGAQTASFNSFRFTFDTSFGNNNDFQLGEIELFGFQGAAPPPPPAGQWVSQTFKRTGNANINNLADADDAINNGVLQGEGFVNSVNYADTPGNPGGGGNFPNSFSPFGLTPGDDEDFTVKSTGFLQISQAGNYQFRNNTDDGSRLRIDLNQDGVFGTGETVILDDVLSGDHNADSALLALLSGQYMIEHVWFERGGGAEGDLGVSFNGGAFLLLGNPQNDGQAAFVASGAFVTAALQIPEPGTIGLLGLAGLALLRRRRLV
ncbi:MAG: PEP-CTERM sorting domain-containing protein [Pyrinomonadaceae bacterium]|nr:PEP-CTERM sorting domain-containing protein [Phycisphaerales bacterium]